MQRINHGDGYSIDGACGVVAWIIYGIVNAVSYAKSTS